MVTSHQGELIQNEKGRAERLELEMCMPAFVHLFASVNGSVCASYLARGSAGLCWHGATRYFQGEQLRKCPWHVLRIVQHTLPDWLDLL